MGEVIQFPSLYRLIENEPAGAPDAPWLDSNVTPQDKLTGRTALRRLMEIHEKHKAKDNE